MISRITVYVRMVGAGKINPKQKWQTIQALSVALDLSDRDYAVS